MPQRYKRDALLAALRAQDASGAGIDITAAAATAGLSRPRASYLYHHGTKGSPPLKELLRPERRQRGDERHDPADLRHRLLRQVAQALDEIDRLLRSEDTVGEAVRLIVGLSGVLERLRPTGKRVLRSEPDNPPPAATEPAGPPVDEEALARRLAAVAAEEDENPSAEVDGKEAA